MKKTNKKGFTIVELVIVIAVIAILAAVLIPTFSNVIEKANKSAALQEAHNTYIAYVADLESIPSEINLIIKGNDSYFAVVKGEMVTTAYASSTAALVEFTEITSPAATQETLTGYTETVWKVAADV